jgi:acetylornithine deacetylase/succinyl-diaminopimelate desuccinylase-like protein
MVDINLVRQEVDRRRDEFLDTLFRLLRQPSISTQNVGVGECAELVAETLEANGISARIMPTAGHPVVYGERIVGEDANTILIYGHYDVQPPEPYEEWLSPPFEPTIRDGRIWARGVGDNKGQFLAHILAVKVLADLDLLPRVNLKFFLEGEEESGSPNLRPFIEQNRDLLAADLFYAADGPSHVSGRPVVCYGVRGHLSMELTATGVNRDLHSGNWGGPSPNPVWMLVDLLSTMRFPDGRATIEGFYENVVPPTGFERQLLENIPFDADEYKANLGIDEFYGPKDMGYFEKILFYPTLNITGISGGYTGAGVKSVIPSKATLKLECRLVKNQTPDEIYAKIERHVQRYGKGITITRKGRGTLPSRASSELPVSRTVADAVAEGYGIEPVVMPQLGASAPNSLFTDELGLPTIWVTYANHDEDNHAPNENMTLDSYFRGIVASAAVIARFAAMDRADVDASLEAHRQG